MSSKDNLVLFLERDDVLIGQRDKDIVVHHKHWKWEGAAKNIVSAARIAMLAEQRFREQVPECPSRGVFICIDGKWTAVFLGNEEECKRTFDRLVANKCCFPVMAVQLRHLGIYTP